MIRPAMERALGKLVMDVAFRDAFFRDPVAACRTVGIELTDRELGALAQIPRGALTAFQRYLTGKWVGSQPEDISA